MTIEPYASNYPSVARHNNAPILVDKKYTVLDSGVRMINWEDVLPGGFQELHDLHSYFHGHEVDNTSDIENAIYEAHYFDQYRHLNWIIIEHSDKKILVLNIHYETYPGRNTREGEPNAEEKYNRFTKLLNRVFKYSSVQIVNISDEIATENSASSIALLGDLEVGNENNAALKVLTDAGFVETWWAKNNGRRRSNGIDHIYVKNMNVISSHYDTNSDYTGANIASDHYPLVAATTIV